MERQPVPLCVDNRLARDYEVHVLGVRLKHHFPFACEPVKSGGGGRNVRPRLVGYDSIARALMRWRSSSFSGRSTSAMSSTLNVEVHNLRHALSPQPVRSILTHCRSQLAVQARLNCLN